MSDRYLHRGNMNDRYLHRGKRVDNGEWVTGYLTKQRHSPLDPNYSAPYNLEYVIDHEEKGLMFTSFIDPSTIGQCTGLSDKNGRITFEGDIINSHYANAPKANHIETVAYNHGRFCAEAKTSSTGRRWTGLANGVPHYMHDKGVYMDYYEIIGNIHDNPELLEGT